MNQEVEPKETLQSCKGSDQPRHLPTMISLRCQHEESVGHQDNMSVCFIPPYTPLLYSKTGVYRSIHFFLFLL